MQTSQVAGRAVAEVEERRTTHLGTRRADQLRETLTRLREIADPYLGVGDLL